MSENVQATIIFVGTISGLFLLIAFVHALIKWGQRYNKFKDYQEKEKESKSQISTSTKRVFFDFSTDNLEYLQSLLFPPNKSVHWRQVTSGFQSIFGYYFPSWVSSGTKVAEESLKLLPSIDEEQAWTTLKEHYHVSAFDFNTDGFNRDFERRPLNYWNVRKTGLMQEEDYQSSWRIHSSKGIINTSVYIPISKLLPESEQNTFWSYVDAVRRENRRDCSTKKFNHDQFVYYVDISLTGKNSDMTATLNISSGLGRLSNGSSYRSDIEYITPMTYKVAGKSKTYAITELETAFTEDLPSELKSILNTQTVAENARYHINELVSYMFSPDPVKQKSARDAFKIWL